MPKLWKFVRILLTAFIAVSCVPSLHAMQRAQGWCQIGAQKVVVRGWTSTTQVMASYPRCTVTVYLAGTTTTATIYSNNLSTPTPLTYQFTANVDGSWAFYAPNGRYDIVLSGGGMPTTFTVSDVLLCDGCGGGGGAYSFSPPFSVSGYSVSMTQADSTHNGYLSYTDWIAFNAKQAALGYTPEQVLTFNAPLSRAVNTISIDLTAYAQNSALPSSKLCGGTDKLNAYDAPSHTFTCGPDQTSGSGTGITSLNGATGSTQTFANGANISVSTNTSTGVHTIATTGLATVATSGAYNDLTGKPTIPSTPSGVGLGNVTNDAQTKAAIVPNTFTGFRYGNNGGVDTAATSAQVQATIGAGVYDASGAAAAKASPGSCTLPNVVRATTTGGVTCAQPTDVSGSATFLSAASALPNGTTATTPNTGDSSTKVATTAFVASAVAAAGGGNVTGPASATAGNFAAIDATGKVISDSGKNASSFAAPNASTTVNGVPCALSGNCTIADATRVYVAGQGTAALGNGSTAIASGSCASVVTVAATGVVTTDVVTWSANGDWSGVTGYGPATSGGVVIYVYPSANAVNFKVCNPTASSITPGATTANWIATRKQ